MGQRGCVPNPGAGVLCKGQQTSELQGISAAVPSLPFRLPGQIADEDTGLSENGYRVYAPVLGQYLQPDPLYGTTAQGGVGPQAYAYANGSPLKYTDSDGRFARGTFNLATGLLRLNDERGAITAEFFSGNRSHGYDDDGELAFRSYDPIPIGDYDILSGPLPNGFYRLEPRDSAYGNDKHEPTGRTQFRLHHFGGSEGCITAKADPINWLTTDAFLKGTSTDSVAVRSHNLVPRCDQSVKRFGTLAVTQ